MNKSMKVDDFIRMKQIKYFHCHHYHKYTDILQKRAISKKIAEAILEI